MNKVRGLADRTDSAAKRLRKEYEHMTVNMSRKTRRFPFEWSMAARVRQQLLDDAANSDADGTPNPSAGYMELKDKLDAGGGLSADEYKSFNAERATLFCRIIADTQLFFTTCSNLASDLVQTAIDEAGAKPSVVILEEAGQCSIPSAAISPLSQGS